MSYSRKGVIVVFLWTFGIPFLTASPFPFQTKFFFCLSSPLPPDFRPESWANCKALARMGWGPEPVFSFSSSSSSFFFFWDSEFGFARTDLGTLHHSFKINRGFWMEMKGLKSELRYCEIGMSHQKKKKIEKWKKWKSLSNLVSISAACLSLPTSPPQYLIVPVMCFRKE
eukprot:TRINITY_DN8976_c0_g1_i1.p1 TRINITY_DN8976_c0_g1~~TRINITY_DN8976_c0_g1_i1.p1  ORF type:complete len:170 (+),score=2.88 TRINITY_DN8976_c0_g1_i1:174-683(+)